jgi:hypothetical protein
MSEIQRYLKKRVRGHRCLYCAEEILDPPSYVQGYWRVWLRRDFKGALEAATSGCPFFTWIVSEVEKSSDPRRDQTFELVFDGPGDDALDAVAVEVRVLTGHYVWPVKKFDVLVDFGIDHRALVCYSTSAKLMC